jgi:hypothetical protein
MLLAGYKRGGQAVRLEPMGDSFRTVSFDVYGPKALACIAGLPGPLQSRCIPLTMFRAAPGSPKPRKRIDEDPPGWQGLRDDLHALALENGPTWLELARRDNACPSMSGRDHELWQPLLAIADWLESCGMQGLLRLVREHALNTIDASQDDQLPDQDEALLRALTDQVRLGLVPQPKDVLEKAREMEPQLFATWSARGVSTVLKRYGIATHKSNGRKVYGRVSLDHLRRIQNSYRFDLGFEEATSPQGSIDDVPHVPQVPLNGQQNTPAGVRGVHGVHPEGVVDGD